MDLKTNTLKPHEAPRSWKFFSGQCLGSEKAPFELSVDSTKSAVDRFSKEAEELRRRAQEIKSSTSPTVMQKNYSKGEWVEVPFTLSQDNKHIWRYETECRNLEDAIAHYNESSASGIEREADEREAYVIWQSRRLDGWRKSKLLTTKDKDEIRLANKTKTAAVRDAKNTVKDQSSEEKSIEPYWTNLDFDDDSWQDTYITKQRETAVAIAKQAFLLGSEGIVYYTWAGGKCLRKEIYNLREFYKLFNQWSEELPLLECLVCGGRLDFQFGELWCLHQAFSLESQRIIDALALLAKVFRRGDKIVHLHVLTRSYEHHWYDICDWNHGRALLLNPECSDFDMFCSVCKAPIKLQYADLQCECPVIEKGQTDDAQTTKEANPKSIFAKVRDFGSNVLSSVSIDQQSQLPSSDLHKRVVCDLTDQLLSQPIEDDEETEEVEELIAQPEVDLLQLAPDSLEEFESWLRKFGVCDGYRSIL